MHSRYLEGGEEIEKGYGAIVQSIWIHPELELLVCFPCSARELELEDRQSRLQQELRERMAVEGESNKYDLVVCMCIFLVLSVLTVFDISVDHLKTDEELSEEKRILNEMLEVVEQRDSLVALLEEQRLREKEEDKDLEAVMLSKGFSMNWSWAQYIYLCWFVFSSWLTLSSPELHG